MKLTFRHLVFVILVNGSIGCCDFPGFVFNNIRSKITVLGSENSTSCFINIFFNSSLNVFFVNPGTKVASFLFRTLTPFLSQERCVACRFNYCKTYACCTFPLSLNHDKEREKIDCHSLF